MEPGGPSHCWAAQLTFDWHRARASFARTPQAVGQMRSPTLCSALIVFPIILISKNCFKFPKFIETYRNVQKLQNKFCMNPLEPIFTVGLTKLAFML
jgi:hypothetical protein